MTLKANISTKSLSLLLILLLPTNVISQDETFKMAEGLINTIDLFNSEENENVSCYRIPALITATNGDLLAAIDERVPSCGDLKWSKDVNIVIRRSSDNGKTWNDIEKIIDFPFGQSASDPSMILDKVTGEIYLFYNYMNHDVAPNIYYLHVIKSNDNGKTWSTPKDITLQITKPEWHKDFKFITSGRGIQTKSGKLLHTMVNLEKGMHLFGSDDHAESWYLIDTPILPGDESKIVELIDGSWMINSRVNNKEGVRYVHTSADEGKTWISKPETTLADPSCNASIIRYSYNNNNKQESVLIFANANSKNSRTNMTVRVSFDEGKSWTKGKTIYKGISAYSSLSVLKNGDIGLFFEKNDYKQNVFTSFSFKWLIE